MNFLITGAGRGIGLELTQFALEGGHSVCALVRDPNNARYLATAKTSYPKQLTILKADVTSRTDLAHAQKELSGITLDVLINNAGVLLDDELPLSSVTDELLSETFAINTFAPLVVTQTFLANLKKAKTPRLINITSLMGSIDDNRSGGYYAYRMSKAALNMFTKNLSLDFPNMISLTLHPGWVRTDMGGARAPLLPRESARGLYQVITNSTLGQSGQFFDYMGKRLNW